MWLDLIIFNCFILPVRFVLKMIIIFDPDHMFTFKKIKSSAFYEKWIAFWIQTINTSAVICEPVE